MHRSLLIVAAVLGGCAALPAAAQTEAVVAGSVVQSLAAQGTTCLRGPAAKGCAGYQERLLRSVDRAAAKERGVSVNELGRRQLEALLASMD